MTSTTLIFTTIFQLYFGITTKKITYQRNRVTLAHVFMEIKRQTHYSIIWNENKVDMNIIVNVNFKNSPLESVLNKCLNITNSRYTITSRIIAISTKND